MPRGVYERTPEIRAKTSKALTGVKRKPFTPEHRSALSKSCEGVPKPPRTQEHCDALSKSHKGDKNPMYGVRGGKDLVNHHYIYDHSDLSLNTIKITRSNHMKLHALLKRLGYMIPHINVDEEL